jgi:ATP-binding cassette subfamily B protein
MATAVIAVAKKAQWPAAAKVPAFPVDFDDDEAAEQGRPLDLDLIRWIFKYTRPYAAKRSALLFAVLLRSIQLPLLAWTISQVINGPIAHRSASGLFWGTLGFLGLSLFTQLTLHFRQRLALELGEAVVHDLRNDIFAHLQRMQLSFFNATKIGRIISRMTSDAEAVRAGVQDVLFTSLVGLGQMIVAAALMAYCDLLLFSIIAGMVPLVWLINQHFRKRLSIAYRAMQESFSRVTSRVAESIQGIQVIQGSVREHTNSRMFRELVYDHSRYNLDAARTAGLFLPLLEFNSQLFLAILLVLGGYRVLDPGAAMPLGNLIQFVFLANIFFQPIQILGDQYNQALMAMAGAERVRRLLSSAADWQDAPGAIRLRTLRGHVRFDNVTFGYDPQRPVLHNISFSAAPGQIVAFVGHTGSGKSSLVNLIAKFYLPGSGRLLIDGHDIRDLDADALRSHMSIVLQQNFLFSGSVLDNVRVGRSTASDDEVAEAIARLGCLDMLESLPAGLRTEVGESGGRLSLGQRQLICFARAMLADPRVLLLDEATSSIDVFTEHRIQQALGKLLEGRTAFVVAHRLSTVRNADVVLLLDNGRIIRRGTPAEVLLDELPPLDLPPQPAVAASAA